MIATLFNQWSNLYKGLENLGVSELLPIGHTRKTVQVTVVLDKRGKFRRAFIVPEKEQSTIIPCTEQSQCNRTSTAIVPHPLMDSLQYLAKGVKGYEKYYDAYYKLLGSFCEFIPKNSSVQTIVASIYKYISNGTLTKDLLTSKILPKKYNPTTEVKLESYKAAMQMRKICIRWEVEIPHKTGSKVWENKQLHKMWQKFLFSQVLDKEGFCLVTGEWSKLATFYPKINMNWGKLISANDSTDFTFRGRQEKAITQISYEVAHQAYNAMQYLWSNKNSILNDDQKILFWLANTDKQLPDVFGSTLDLLSSIVDEDFIGNTSNSGLVCGDYVNRLQKAIRGYKVNIKDSDNILMVELCGTTPGRVAVVDYRTIKNSEFLANVLRWHDAYSWNFRYMSKDKKWTYSIGAPSLASIVGAAKTVEGKSSHTQKLWRTLIDCVITGKVVPDYIIKAVENKALKTPDIDMTNLLCSLYKGRYYNEREVAVSLDKSITDESYLHGRLFTMFDYIEEYALSMQKNKRGTNTAKLYVTYQRCPGKTAKELLNKLNPYIQFLKEHSPGFYAIMEKELDSIFSKFVLGLNDNFKLDIGQFVMGRSCERESLRLDRAEYWKSKEEKKNSKNAEKSTKKQSKNKK